MAIIDIKNVSSMKKLLWFAWFVVAPREFLIVAIINVPIFLFFYYKAESVTIAGSAPLLNYLGPMFFVLPLITTYFGFRNGILARRWGIGPALPEGKIPRKMWAIIAGTIWGCLCCPLCIILGLKLQAAFPDLQFPMWAGAIIVGIVSGTAGYILHALAICFSSLILIKHSS